MTETPSSADLRTQILNALDPTGEMARMLEVFDKSDLFPSDLLELIDNPLAKLSTLADRQRDPIDQAERSVRVLCPRGWSISEMDSQSLTKAVELVECCQGTEADALLADVWGEDWPIQ